MKKNVYGPLYYYWDECEETVSIGEDLALALIKKGFFTGKTYLDVMSTEFTRQVIDLNEKEIKDYLLLVKRKKRYQKLLKDIEELIMIIIKKLNLYIMQRFYILH